ncbi:MAG: hypothetical protein ACKOEC_05920 [Acidimicrobiia bacterium]
MSSRARPFALAALYGVLSVAFCWPLFDHPLGLGTNDWDQHLFYYGVVLKNVVEYGQMPFWNPWYCGGNVMWQNPQVAVLSPVYPLALIAPLQLAMKINIVLHYWIGFVGMHLLVTRIIGITFLPVVIYLATLVTASGAQAIHLRVGHSVFLPGFYLPLQVFFVFRALRTGEWKYVLLAGMTMALMVANGGTHILPMSIAAIGCFALVTSIARRDWRPVALAVAFGVAALAYSAPKLLPVVQFVQSEQFSDTRNPTEKPDLVTMQMLKQVYLTPTQDVGARLPMQRHGWHEYGNYIGIGSAVALIAGLVVALWAGGIGIPLAITTISLFLLSLGEFSSIAPAVLIQKLPLFSSFRIPSRYSIPFLQFAALSLAWAYHAITQRYTLSTVTRVVVAFVALAASAHLIAVNRWNLKDVFTIDAFNTHFSWNSGPRAIDTDTESSPYTPDSPMLKALMADRAFLNCYESLQLARGAGSGSPVVDSNAPPRIGDVAFTPNRITFTVNDGAAPAHVILNQNWSEGWTSDAGPITTGKPTELSFVEVPPGTTGRFSFHFVPPGFYLGLGVSAAALIATALLWRRTLSPTS